MRILAFGLDKSALDIASPLAKRLAGYGREVKRYDLIVPSAEKAKAIISNNVEVYGTGGGNKLMQLFRLKLLALSLIIKNRYQVISVQDQHYLGLMAWLIARFFGLGLELQVHGWEKKSGLRLSIAKFLCRRADSVRAVSERLKKDLTDNFNVQPDKITVAPIFSARLSEAGSMPEKNHQAGKFIYLTVGRLVPVKNIGLQIEAFANLIKQHAQAELWIAGEGKERANLEKIAADFGLQGKIKFLGWQDSASLQKIYSQADCFVISSNEEGYGLVAVEAARFGLPIIMTDVGLAGEFIKHQENGLIIPVGDSQALEQAMARIMAEPGLAEKLGAQAKLAVSALPDQQASLALYKESWQRAATTCRSGRFKVMLKEHGKYLGIILLFAAAAIFVRYANFPFTTWASDSIQYMETAKHFLGQGGEIYPSRILKPLAPLGVGLISYFTGGNMMTALLAEAAICYVFLGWVIYYLLNLFFHDKKLALIGSILYISSYPLLKYGLDLYTETGAQMFWLLAVCGVINFYRKPSDFNLYLTMLAVIIGMLWKEYSSLGMVFLYLVIIFHPRIAMIEKIKKLALSTIIVGLPLIAWMIIVYLSYHYTYFEWFKAGVSAPSGSEYQPFFVLKSIVGVYLAGWVLVPLGLIKWREFSAEQKFLLKCLVPPSFMFLIWTGVSSRLYFVLALLLTLLAVNGLKGFFRGWTARIIIVLSAVAVNFYWLSVSGGLKLFFNRFL